MQLARKDQQREKKGEDANAYRKNTRLLPQGTIGQKMRSKGKGGKKKKKKKQETGCDQRPPTQKSDGRRP